MSLPANTNKIFVIGGQQYVVPAELADAVTERIAELERDRDLAEHRRDVALDIMDQRADRIAELEQELKQWDGISKGVEKTIAEIEGVGYNRALDDVFKKIYTLKRVES